MQNKFGLKDFVLLVLVIGIGLLVLLAIFQEDRRWDSVRSLDTRIREQERLLSRLEGATQENAEAVAQAVQEIAERLDELAMLSARLSADGAAPLSEEERARIEALRQQPGSTQPRASAGGRDESWARPGAKVQWQPTLVYANDPRSQPNFTPGGELTEIYEAQLSRLTPYISSDVYARRIQELTLGSLGIYDPVTLKMRGQVAEAWQVDPEGMWMRARIRANARFSDGVPITAEDIRWTFHDYVMNEQIEAERSRSTLRDSIERVEVIDPRTVEFHFTQRLFLNVDNALGLFILPKHVYSQFTAAQINRATGLLVGSGPFKLKDFDPDRQWTPPADVVMERNEQYWGPKPAMAGLRIKAINDEIPRLNAFKKGEGDIITPAATQFVSMTQDPQWKDRAQYLKWVNMRSGYSFICWNCGERNGKLTPFHDVRVRRAMTHIIDREKMIRDIWRGVGEVAKGNMPLGTAGANPDIRPWPFDPERARQLFKEAGWEDRNGNGVLEDAAGNEFEFEFSYASGGEISEKIARFVVDSCAAAGIRVRLRPADWSVYQDYMKTRDFDAITLGWGASAPESDPKQIFHSDSIRNQGDNFAQWANAEADRLIDEGRREMDDDKRAAIWRQLERVLHEEGPYTFVRVPPWLRIVGQEIGNVHTYPKGIEHPEFFRSAGAAPMRGN
ncbi:MAG: hypothetical protein KF699_00910 [Phycisphaeraceae bacterium]|nr:hypothetical protein [Phycisphaeraceae bacterium]MBX3406086.1 hypothetical protein [Phycisphaeraceae bacterium]